MKLAVALALVVALALASVDCGDCNASCTNFVNGAGTTTGDVSTALNTTVCISGACSTTAITFDNGYAAGTYSGDVIGDVTLSPQGAITLRVFAKANGFNDGDVYGLLVNASNGTLVSKTSAPIKYTHVTACGTSCMQAMFTF